MCNYKLAMKWNDVLLRNMTKASKLVLPFPLPLLLPSRAILPWEFQKQKESQSYLNWIELGDSVNFLSLSRRIFWWLLNPLVENWSKTIKVLLLKSHRVHLHPPAFEQNVASDILAVSTSAGGILHLVLQGPQQSYERYPEVLDILLCCELSTAWVFEFQYLFPTPAGSPCCVYRCEIAWLLDSPTPRENPDGHVRTYNSISYPNDHRSGHYCVQPQQRAHSWIYPYMRICHSYYVHQESGCLPNASPPCSRRASSNFHQSFPLLPLSSNQCRPHAAPSDSKTWRKADLKFKGNDTSLDGERPCEYHWLVACMETWKQQKAYQSEGFLVHHLYHNILYPRLSSEYLRYECIGGVSLMYDCTIESIETKRKHSSKATQTLPETFPSK